MKSYAASLLVLAASMLIPHFAEADEEEEQWLVELRNSGTYKKGIDHAVDVIERAYDIGAVGGASQWMLIHEYHRQAATAKGCRTGAKLAAKSASTCPKLGGSKPGVVSKDLNADKKRALEPAATALRPELVRRVLTTVHSYGYANGLEYGWRKNDGDVAWTGRYYKACMEFADDANIEKQCANAADQWAATEIARLKKQARAKQLPIPESR